MSPDLAQRCSCRLVRGQGRYTLCPASTSAARQISEKDEAVLAYLEDITCQDLAAAPRAPKAPKAAGGGQEEEEEEEEEEDEPCGFTLTFHFAPNPFFKHATLVRAARRAAELLLLLGLCEDTCGSCWAIAHADATPNSK